MFNSNSTIKKTFFRTLFSLLLFNRTIRAQQSSNKTAKMYTNKKSQVSMEYLVTVSLSLLIILGLIGLVYVYSNIIHEEIIERQLSSAGQLIMNSGTQIFYMGDYSKTTLTVYFPNRINNVFFYNNTIVFDYTNYYGHKAKIIVPSQIKIDGIIRSYEGYHKIRIFLTKNGVWVQD